MINSKAARLLVNVIIIFSIILLCNMSLYSDNVFAMDSIGDLDQYNGRKWWKFTEIRRQS